MKKEDIIYTIGHKSPDTDTVCSAIAYAEYLRSKGENVIPSRCGEINLETKYVLEYFGVEHPINLSSIDNKKVILVDYNEVSQSPEGLENAKILGVIDHHKIGFSSSEPISFEIKPYGATATIIAEKMVGDVNFKITKPIAGILISSILSDTVVFKSTTTTNKDIEMVEELNKIAQIEDIKKFGIEIKKKKSSLAGLSPEEIIFSDFKNFEINNINFGIGQIEVVDLNEAKEIKKELLREIDAIAERDNFLFVILMVTDIINEGSELLFSKNHDSIKNIFSEQIVDSIIYIKGMMSRKKDLVPLIINQMEKK
jgi:manganese-dependent inorganic pyrophosphatase